MRLTKTGLYTIYLLSFVFLISGTILFDSCNNKPKSPGDDFKAIGNTIEDGKRLVQIYCTKCHAEVPANALTKEVWTIHTLPAMAHYLKVSTYGTAFYKNPTDTGGISLENLQILKDYFQKVAPDSLPVAAPPTPLLNDWAGFSLLKPNPLDKVSYSTMIAVDQSTQKIYSSDLTNSKLYEWDRNLKMRTVAQLPSPGVDAIFTKNEKGADTALVTCVGEFLKMDFPNGKLVTVNLGDKNEITVPGVVASEVFRPVQTVQGDFNKDGRTDLVVCAQGNKSGRVLLLTQKADHTYDQNTIIKKTGAVEARVGDFNNDGWPDVMVLFGSGDEGLWLFLNDQKGGFTKKDLLHFPPVYGSTSFQLVDMNHDGKLDLIYTCGYNFNDSRIFKPYHGLYIFLNEGDWKFKQSYFYPINGCTKAIATDFDGDGDIDIATTAFFADLRRKPNEGFIYFEQDKAMNFKPHAIPVNKYGRWMGIDTISKANGRPDIVLGNYAKGFMIDSKIKPFWDINLPLIVLENHNKK
ncbi:MAG TPA: VCBS repeat-containing protein [Mucilaginibacter sp.]